MVKVLLSEDINSEAKKLLIDKGYDLVISPSTDEKTMIGEIADVDALILRSSPLNANIIKKANNLKIISRHGTGINNIDLDACNEKKILVTKVNGANSYSVAEYHITMILALSRRIFKSDRKFREGKMNSQNESLIGLANKYDLNGSEIRDKNLAILGYGAIGKKLSSLAYALNMNVRCYDPFVEKADIPIVRDKEDLIKWADFISICMPLTPETENFISEKELDLIKDSAYIINAGRGGIVDEDALSKALYENKIAGAALDVFVDEPPKKDSLILKAPNTILTSHIGGTTFEASKSLSFGSCKNIIEFFDGKIPESSVNKEILE